MTDDHIQLRAQQQKAQAQVQKHAQPPQDHGVEQKRVTQERDLRLAKEQQAQQRVRQQRDQRRVQQMQQAQQRVRQQRGR
jgi:hypothetical protein